MTYDYDNQQDGEEQEKNKEEEKLQKELIKAYGSYSNTGLAKYHIKETAKLILASKEYQAIDALLDSGRKTTTSITDKLQLSVESIKRLYHSAVQTMLDYKSQRDKEDEDMFYSKPLFMKRYLF